MSIVHVKYVCHSGEDGRKAVSGTMRISGGSILVEICKMYRMKVYG